MFACAARFAPRFTIEKEETLPMKMLRRSVCLLLCAALFLTLLAGCGKQEEPAEDFVVSAAVCGPLETLDPTMNTDVGTEPARRSPWRASPRNTSRKRITTTP